MSLSSEHNIEANPEGAMWALPSLEAERMYPEKIEKFGNRVLCIEMGRAHNVEQAKQDFRIKEYYRMFIPMHPTKKFTKLMLGLAFPWMSSCEIMEPNDPMMPVSSLGVSEFPMLSLAYVRTPYNICAIYLQYLRDDSDIFEIEPGMSCRMRLEAAVYGVKGNDRIQKEYRFAPPMLVSGPGANVTIVGSQSGKIVAPDVVGMSIVVQKVCNACGSRPNAVNVKAFKRCAGCIQNGQMACWYCSKECQRLDYRFHKVACQTPSGSRELQSRLDVVGTMPVF